MIKKLNGKIRLENILIILFFINLLLYGLYNGGGWNLNQQIDFSDRLITGLSFYSDGENDLFVPSSPYFPGVGYLSYLIQIIGFTEISVVNIILMCIACSIGYVLFFLLTKLTSKIYPNIPKEIILITIVTLITTNFTAFFRYVSSFKPDATLLVIGLTSLIILEKTNKLKIYQLIQIGILLCLSVLFKQSFFLIYFLIYLAILFRKDLNIRQKIFILIAYSFFGLSIITALFIKVENLYTYTIETMSNHGFLGTKEILRIFGGTIVYNFIFIGLLLHFIILKIRTKSFNNLELIYFTFSCAWLLFALISSIKVGGNRGNSEVGLIVFLPFVCFSINELFKISSYKKKISLILKIIISVIIIPYYSISIIRNSKKVNTKYNNDITIINYLNKNFKSKKAFVDSKTYMVSKESGLDIITEAETVGHFNLVENYDFSILKNAIENKKYDLIYLEKSLDFLKDKEIQIKINDNYQSIKQNGAPQKIKNKLLIPKKTNF